MFKGGQGGNTMSEFKKYHKIKILGDEENKNIFDNPEDDIIIEEKMDGGNFRFVYGKQGLILGSRTRELDDDNPNSKSFLRCINFIKSKLELNVLRGDNLIFFGECMIKHSMNYDWENIPPFLGFDIFDLKTDMFLDYDKKKELFDYYGLPMVPLIGIKKAKEIKEITDDNVPDSKYYSPSAKDKKAEGIVLKNYSKQIFAKYVRDEFREINKEAFGDSKKWARQNGDNELLVATYCTNARIDKAIFKLIEDGEKLDMTIMSLLPKAVIKDIYEENWQDVCYSNWNIDFRNVRKLITIRCLSVLKQVIVNNSLNLEEKQ